LSDREVLMVGSGRCYRVSLSNHYERSAFWSQHPWKSDHVD
jgi:hypothetical protein